MHAGGTQSVTTQGLGGAQRRNLVAKCLFQRFQLGYITGRCAGAVGIDVADLAIQVFHGLLHAPHCAFATRGDHIRAV